MAALNFPDTPTTGQVFVGGNGVVYTWTGTLWLASGASAGGDFCANQTSSFPVVDGSSPVLILTQVISGNSTGVYSTSTGRYSPPAGRYFIMASMAGYSSTGVHLAVTLRKNGTNIVAGNDGTGSGILRGNPVVETVVDANGTDYFDITGYTNGTITLEGITFLAYPISGIKGPPGDATPGTLIQTVSTQTGAVATGTTVIPVDDTIPQIGEGNEYMTLAITPRSATSKLVIEVLWNGAVSTAVNMTVGLFQDAAANALAAVFHAPANANFFSNVRLTHTMTSGTTSATTFRVRAGPSNTGTMTFNGGSGARLYGGVMASSIVIQEVAP